MRPEFCSWNQQIKAKMLTFVLLTEKRLVVSTWTFFKFLQFLAIKAN